MSDIYCKSSAGCNTALVINGYLIVALETLKLGLTYYTDIIVNVFQSSV